MIKPEETIYKLKEKLTPLIGERFGFDKVNSFPIEYVLRCGYCVETVTRGETIKIINFFEDYWIYMKITFNPYEKKVKRGTTETFFNVMFTLSIFYGGFSDKKKHLFRAEWDNYEKDDSSHPQPHWHFYMNDEEIDSESFESSVENTKSGFAESLESEKKEFQKIHFAMNAQWSETNKSHIHKIDNTDTFIEWTFGLIDHIRVQLEYIDK